MATNRTPRRRPPRAEPSGDVQPHVLRPTAVYTLDTATRALGLDRTTLRNEITRGAVRRAKRGGKVYFLGAWLLEWVRRGEVRRGGAPAP